MRYSYTKLRESRLLSLLAETGAVGLLSAPTAESVLTHTGSLENGQIYYLKPAVGRGLMSARGDPSFPLFPLPCNHR